MRSVDWRSCSPLSLVLYDKRFMLRPAHKHGNDDVDVKVLCFEKIDRLDPAPPPPPPYAFSNEQWSRQHHFSTRNKKSNSARSWDWRQQSVLMTRINNSWVLSPNRHKWFKMHICIYVSKCILKITKLPFPFFLFSPSFLNERIL